MDTGRKYGHKVFLPCHFPVGFRRTLLKLVLRRPCLFRLRRCEQGKATSKCNERWNTAIQAAVFNIQDGRLMFERVGKPLARAATCRTSSSEISERLPSNRIYSQTAKLSATDILPLIRLDWTTCRCVSCVGATI